MADIGYLIAGINSVVSICILVMSIVTAQRLRGSVIRWASLFFLATGLLFAAHAFIEVLGFGEELYSLTALVATLLLGFTIIIIDITTKMLGVKS